METPETLRERYAAALLYQGFERDPAQQRAVTAFEDLHGRLLAAPSPTFWQTLLRREPPPVKGLYLWGGVGRGKTWLMDGFYETLPPEDKLRLHFHRFMREVHAELKKLGGRRDPLRRVAEHFRARARVICFDEFYVSDITDAMLLGRLFQQLFARGLTLVATSNVPPDELYKSGLQRERFLPAIKLIKTHCQVMDVDGGTDYRLRHMRGGDLYCVPAGAEADARLEAVFTGLTGHHPPRIGLLTVNERPIPVRRYVDGVAWFGFDALCETARSQDDYIEIARSFHTVLLSGVPIFGADTEDAARRFIALVDEFYDRRVKLALTAAAAPEKLYAGKRLAFEFQRAASRLAEMQTKEYLSLPHLP
ncbi:MAG: cell division protein ZapE [Bacillota bacterium]